MSEKLLNRRNRWIIGGAAGLLVVGGSAALATAAFADDGDDIDDKGASQVADNDDGDDDGSPTTAPKVSLGDAAAAAADKVSKGILTSIELEGSNDNPRWQVDLVTSDGTEHDVTVDATDGKVTSHDKDSDDDGEDWKEAKSLNDQAKTSPEAAAAAALDKVGKGTVTSVELDDDNTTASWDVDVTTDKGEFKSVTVDASNGKVTDVYTDDDDDNDGDDSDDDSDDQNDDNDTDDGDDD